MKSMVTLQFTSMEVASGLQFENETLRSFPSYPHLFLQ